MLVRSQSALATVRDCVRQIETVRMAHGVLSFELDAIDWLLPCSGLAFRALHEVAGGSGAVHGAAAALFAAGIMARTTGQILWCVTRRDLFAPALAQAGLHSDRVIYAEVGDEQSVLACFENGLRHGGMGGVVGEVAKLPTTASRRLLRWSRLFGQFGGEVKLIPGFDYAASRSVSDGGASSAIGRISFAP